MNNKRKRKSNASVIPKNDLVKQAKKLEKELMRNKTANVHIDWSNVHKTRTAI